MKHTAHWIWSLLLLVLLVGACSGSIFPNIEEPAPTPGDQVGTLHMAYGVWWGGIDSLDPASAVPFYDAINVLYERLVRVDADGTFVPELAESWTFNDDATVWTFTLRAGVTFHNGTPLTSADVAYSIERLLDPQQEAGLSGVYDVIWRIETPDKRTVVFHLTQPHAELPALFTAYRASIIPADSGETIGETGIGTGSFQLEQLDPEGTTRMTAYPNHWRGTPGLNAIEFIGISDPDDRFQALQDGQIDLLFEVSPQQALLLDSDSTFVVKTFPGGIWPSITMRTDTPPFDDVRVRQALRLVADREAMLTVIQKGAGIIACDSTVWPGDPHRWWGTCPQDVMRARRLLAEAGYVDNLEVTLFTSDSLPWMIPLAEVYQEQAATAGINVTIQEVPDERYWTEVFRVEPFIMDGEFQYPADLSLYLFYESGSAYNASYFNDLTFEEMLADARATLDPEERDRRYKAAQEYLFEVSGTLIPYHTSEIVAFRRTVSGVEQVHYLDLPWHDVTIAEE